MAEGKRHSVYQLKVSLDGMKPPIWRRILLPAHMNLKDLHRAIQASMGWADYHLHQFVQRGMFFGLPDDEFGMHIEDENEYTISDLLPQEKDKMKYEYDFGDSWEHTVLLEKILPADDTLQLPSCIKGKRACPPEDCGGIWGYQELLEIIHDPSHPEYEETLEWLGGKYDPEHFDLAAVNRKLAKLK